ncbi:MAG: EVE domain-containing protein [Oligoflexia bacterium]|nr:EVE domain-containing protein [Oligoflexia bacterium]
MTKPTYWLLKTEPQTYSFEQLLAEGRTAWNGVRNFQARNFLREISRGDLAIIYHSGEQRSAIGIARIIREHYPDPDPAKPGDWVQLDLAAEKKLPRPVSLAEMKAERALADLPLLRQSRLSVMPISAAHFEAILKLAGA